MATHPLAEITPNGSFDAADATGVTATSCSSSRKHMNDDSDRQHSRKSTRIESDSHHEQGILRATKGIPMNTTISTNTVDGAAFSLSSHPFQKNQHQQYSQGNSNGNNTKIAGAKRSRADSSDLFLSSSGKRQLHVALEGVHMSATNESAPSLPAATNIQFTHPGCVDNRITAIPGKDESTGRTTMTCVQGFDTGTNNAAGTPAEQQEGINNTDESNEGGNGVVEEEEPDWQQLAQQEPSKTDIPIFLAARDERDAAEERFAAVLDEFHASFKNMQDTILGVAVEIHNRHRERIDAMESDIKSTIVWNHEMRTKMEAKLQETVTASQGYFQRLLLSLNNPDRSLSSAGASTSST